MKSNKTKYLIIVLIALFFASTNELDARESEQNYNIENHSFVETSNSYIKASIDKQENNYNKNFFPDLFLLSPDNYWNICFDSSYSNYLDFLPQFFRQKIHLEISVLRI